MKNKGFIVFLATYLLATLVRGITGVSFNPFFDKFDLVLFLKDIIIWIFSYIISSFIISKLTKQKD